MSTASLIAGILLAMYPGLSPGAVVVSLNSSGSKTSHEVSVAPGDTFSLDVNVAVEAAVGGVSTQLQASASHIIGITQVVWQSPWDSGTGSSIPIGMLDPLSGDLRRMLTHSPMFGPGFSTVATIDFKVDEAAAIGTYTLDTTDILIYDSPRVPVEPYTGSPGPSFVVRIVPEPVSLLFWVVGTQVALACRCRQRPSREHGGSKRGRA